VATIADYLGLLLQWNVRVNLTGARTADELVGDHLPDSFALAQLVPAGARVVDVGAGGGLPGVPFAVLRPDCHVLLVDPRAKRTAFLAAAKRMVGAGASMEVARCRHDELLPLSFDVASSRATFAPEEWLAVGSPLVKVDGRVVVFAATPLGDEVPGCLLVDSVRYATDSGAPRWVGAYVPRGTISTAG
jgi:16S rRNA (guanine527-N7)-methyltransferase